MRIQIEEFEPIMTMGQQFQKINRILKASGLGPLLGCHEDDTSKPLKATLMLEIDSIVKGKRCLVDIDFTNMKILKVRVKK